MSDWRTMRIDGLGPIVRVVAVFQMGPPLQRLPFPSFKVKVLERGEGHFLAVPNVALNSAGQPDWTSGVGETIDSAMECALRAFIQSLGDQLDFMESDFSW